MCVGVMHPPPRRQMVGRPSVQFSPVLPSNYEPVLTIRVTVEFGETLDRDRLDLPAAPFLLVTGRFTDRIWTSL